MDREKNKYFEKQCEGKKLLILAGASVHKKLVEAAKSMGVYTIVTDYLETSPAKQLADEAWNLNITDTNRIVEKCREAKIDGIITGWIDPCQRPYEEICRNLKVPCLGTAKQFLTMTDKHLFKKMCEDNGVLVIPEYTEQQCRNGNAEYPVFVKPVDSRGSRGQSVCTNWKEVECAIEFAKRESSNGDILIEKYMGDCNEFQVTYFFVDGKAFLIRTVDSYTGTEQDKLNKVVACSVSPAACTEQYMKNANNKVIRMFQNLGIKNGPIFMQGFEKNGDFYFFDPGLRFPGVDYERVFTEVFHIDFMKMMIAYALQGEMPAVNIPEDAVFLNNQYSAILFPTIGAGNIKKIRGFDTLAEEKEIVSILQRAFEGENICWTYDVNQRLAEIDLLCSSKKELKKTINRIQQTIQVTDEHNQSLVFGVFDTERIR